MSHFDEALVLLLALVGLYSPVAAVSSHIPLLQTFDAKQQMRLALGLFFNVAGIAVVTILAGEPLLELLGLTTAALSATGGISLMIAAVPLMTGKTGGPTDDPGALGGDAPAPPGSWRSVVFMPLTFPLTIGGATIGILVGFRAEVRGVARVTWLVACRTGSGSRSVLRPHPDCGATPRRPAPPTADATRCNVSQSGG